MNNQTSGELADSDSQTRPRAPSAAEALVDDYEKLEVSDHPLFVELRARPVDLTAIWVLMANLAQGISREFVIWLAQTIARVEDRRVASLLAKQLNDELGSGAFDQIHSTLLQRFVDGLEPWRPTLIGNATLGPGRALAEAGSLLFQAHDVYEALGALMVGEIFAKKMDHCVGDEIRRQHALSTEVLSWLTLHETLEIDHADDSRELAALIPDSEPALTALRKGARAQWRLLWEFLDGVRGVVSSSYVS
jgi:pyrroloquinoline quinone (PQQ) biosynthesis protein C